MLFMKGDGQWFGTDVGRVILCSDPLELDGSASDLLLDVVDDADQVLASAVGVSRLTDRGLRVRVDDGGLHLCVGELHEESAEPD